MEAHNDQLKKKIWTCSKLEWNFFPRAPQSSEVFDHIWSLDGNPNSKVADVTRVLHVNANYTNCTHIFVLGAHVQW